VLARALPAFEYRRMRWKNNLGWTREILRAPDADDYDWRVSIAEIDHDCPFSAFPGHDRVLVLLSGNGMRLDFADGRSETLEPPHGRLAFRGEDALDCTLLDGPTRDFNLIWRRDRVRAGLMLRPLVGPMLFFPETGVQWLAFLAGGRAHLKDRPDVPPLEAGDSLWLAAEADAPQRAILDGGGTLLLARIEPNSAP
jgi:environmental stress-induced protein Ves